MAHKFWLILFYGFANHLPNSYSYFFGGLWNRIRIAICRHIFNYCGKVTTINRNIYFGNGKNVKIGDYSGIGANCTIPNNIQIGKYVMMGPDLYCISFGHSVSDTNILMCFQPHEDTPIGENIIIDDDVWIGARVIICKRRHIGKGSIIAAGAVVTKDVEPWTVVGGNPAKFIKNRVIKD